MRTLQVLALIALASTAFAVKLGVTEEAQASLQNMEGEMGFIAATFMEISEISETEQVRVIMEKIQKETDAEHDTLESDLQDITKKFKADKKRLETLISNLKDKIQEKENEIKEQEALIDRTENAIATAEKNIQQATDDIKDENKRYRNFVGKMLIKIANQREAVAACNDALKIVAEFKSKDLGSADQIKAGNSTKHAFIQTSTGLKTHLNKIRDFLLEHNPDSIHIQTVETFLEIADAGVNSNFVARLQNLIQNLRDSIKADIKENKATLAAEKKKHDSLIAKLKGIIKANQAIIDDLTPKLATYKKELKAMKAVLASLQKSLKQAQDTLVDVIAEYKKQKARYEKQIARLATDSAALQYAINYLKKQSYAGGEKTLA